MCMYSLSLMYLYIRDTGIFSLTHTHTHTRTHARARARASHANKGFFNLIESRDVFLIRRIMGPLGPA